MKKGDGGWIQKRAVPGAPPIPVATPAPAPAPPRREATFVDQGAEFEGTLRLRESFRIDCEFRGEIFSEGTVTIGESAGIQADIQAREVVIAGAVVGNVKASRQLVLRSGARLHGDVETPCFELEKGAFFNGHTRMMRPELALRAAPAATYPPPDGPTPPTPDA
jgi:cytoskeletal protein CcmA (bactofilin family)